MSKDNKFVAMEQHACIVCTETYDTGAILLHKRLQEIKSPVTGWGLCPKHQNMKDKGFVFLVGADPSRTDIFDGRVRKPEDVYRTGRYAAVREEVFSQLFDAEVPPQKVCFVDEQVIDYLQNIQKETDDGGEKEDNA